MELFERSIVLRARAESLAIRDLTRTWLVLGVSIFLFAIVIAFTTKRLSICDRNLYTLFGLFPSVSYMLAVILYRRRSRIIDRSRPFFWRSLVLVFVLALPSIFLVVRNMLPGFVGWGKWGLVGSLLLLFLMPLPRLTPSLDARHAWELLVWQYFQVMWVPEKPILVEPLSFLERAPHYTKNPSLAVFQETWNGQLVEARACCEMICEKFAGHSHAIRSILDVGCGEGKFTKQLLSELKARQMLASSVDVVGIDPVLWGDEYRERVESISGVKGSFRLCRLSDVPREMSDGEALQSDLVLASHSLYGVCDDSVSSTVSKPMSIADAIQRLQSFRTGDGSVLLILASRRSWAYEFKRRALELIFDSAIDDLTSEDLVSYPASPRLRRRLIDGLFELEKWVRPWLDPEPDLEKDRQGLVGWLEYFLRAPLSENDPVTEECVRLLGEFLIHRSSLPHELAVHDLGPAAGENDRVLLHKTEIWLL